MMPELVELLVMHLQELQVVIVVHWEMHLRKKELKIAVGSEKTQQQSGF